MKYIRLGHLVLMMIGNVIEDIGVPITKINVLRVDYSERLIHHDREISTRMIYHYFKLYMNMSKSKIFLCYFTVFAINIAWQNTVNSATDNIDKRVLATNESVDLHKKSNFLEKENIQLILENLSGEDRESLDKFFRNLIVFDSIGYVIFGYKPMVWGNLSAKKTCINLRSTEIIFYDRSWNDYLVWKKYQHLFQMKNYIFRVYNSPYIDDNRDFLFINKKKCIETVQDNLNLFKKKLGNSITAEYILQQLETKEDIIDEVFHGNEDLLGLLLGFGKHNSQTYQNRLELENQYRPPFDIDKICNIKLTGFPSNDEEKQPFNFISLPYFVEDKDHP